MFLAIGSASAADLARRQTALAHRRIVQARAVESFKHHHMSRGAVGFVEVGESLRPIYLGASRIPKVKKAKCS